MLHYSDAFYQLKKSLQNIYDESEAASIAHELLEHITGKNRLQRLNEKNYVLDEMQQTRFDIAEQRLLSGEPLQYVTGSAWFMGRKYTVNKNVLIPRPETEELVQWIIDNHKDKKEISILDMGTGSGCIAISLRLALHNAIVEACDISPAALEVAKLNASRLGADVRFFQTDILSSKTWELMPMYDVIVSNPPYIPESEKDSLDMNVRNFEPELALFTPADDALLFYRAIADFARKHLNNSGAVYCELHRDYTEDTKQLFLDSGFHAELKKDMHGNLRMLKAMK